MSLIIPGLRGLPGADGADGADGATGAEPDVITFTKFTTPGITGSFPHWYKTTVDYTDYYGVAATTSTINLYTLEGNAVIHAVVIKPTIIWQGGKGLAAPQMAIGSGITNEKHKTFTNLYFPVTDINLGFDWLPAVYSIGTTTKHITATVQTTFGNLNLLTQGECDIYILMSKL